MTMDKTKYLMHGVLWFLHKDHHKRKKEQGFFERNDFFFLVFAIPGIISILAGVHDIFIHQRFRFLKHSDNMYFSAIRRAHKDHHRHLEKEDGECFGMLWVPMKYFRIMKRKV